MVVVLGLLFFLNSFSLLLEKIFPVNTSSGQLDLWTKFFYQNIFQNAVTFIHNSVCLCTDDTFLSLKNNISQLVHMYFEKG